MARAQARVLKPVILEEEEETLEDIRPRGRVQSLESVDEPNDWLSIRNVFAWAASGALHLILVGSLLGVQSIYQPPSPTSPEYINAGPIIDDGGLPVPPIDPLEPRPGELPNHSEGPQPVSPDPNPDPLPPIVLPEPTPDGERIDPYDLPIKGLGRKSGTGGPPFDSPGYDRRNPKIRDAIVKQEGGNKESELAVARGLSWLAHQQKDNGSWSFDGTAVADPVAATALALLPFLAAGQTHKTKDSPYSAVIRKGLTFLVDQQKADGGFNGGNNATRMYAHGIATLALCEALGMSGDSYGLTEPAQKAVNYIVKAQAPKGGWWYEPRLNGDLSVTGWQIQALQSARICHDLRVPLPVIKRANEFLDALASGKDKSRYGYTDKRAVTPARTAVGLLSRTYVDNWDSNNLGMIDGVKYLMEHGVPGKTDKKDIYYCYYATQVIHNYGHNEWNVRWNPSVRNWLVELQVAPGNENAGSWDPEDSGEAKSFGRLGQTCFSVLTLEVYYRMPPPKASSSAETEKSK